MADKPSHRYFGFCNHTNHRSADCPDKKPLRGKEHPSGMIKFRKRPEGGKGGKP
jgi:hypothetical protein